MKQDLKTVINYEETIENKFKKILTMVILHNLKNNLSDIEP